MMMTTNELVVGITRSFMTGTCTLLIVAALQSSCAKQKPQNLVNAALVNRIRDSMSREQVETLLGEPHRTSYMYYDPDNTNKATVLTYKLDDGRLWMVIIDEHDDVIGSGEKDVGRIEEPILK